jgi:hypothetical protein
MTTNYARGRAFEYKVRDKMYEQGAVLVLRSAGSKTKVDLIALFPIIDSITYEGDIQAMLVQCKKDGNLPAAEREELMRISELTGVRAYHARSGPNGRGVEIVELQRRT